MNQLVTKEQKQEQSALRPVATNYYYITTTTITITITITITTIFIKMLCFILYKVNVLNIYDEVKVVIRFKTFGFSYNKST